MYKISTAQMPITKHDSFSDWSQMIEEWVEQAVQNDSKIALFPEFSSLSLASLLSDNQRQDPDEMLYGMQKLLPDYHQTLLDLAAKYKIIIVGGSFATQDGDALYNRAHLYDAKGIMGYQDKIILTRFEREKTTIKAGNEINIFETEFGKFSVAICFDSQFPVLIRKAVDAGIKLLLVPSCTGRMSGFNRVRIGCQARALENQMPVIQSSTVGEAAWQPIADTNCGAAALYGPPDNGFPDDGIIMIGEPNKSQWVHVNVDFDAFAKIRENGHVRNWSCWDEQYTFLKASAA